MANTNDRIISSGNDASNNMFISSGNTVSITSATQSGSIKISSTGLGDFAIPGAGIEFINPSITGSMGLHGLGTIGIMIMQVKNTGSGVSSRISGTSSGSINLRTDSSVGFVQLSVDTGAISEYLANDLAIQTSYTGTKQFVTTFHSAPSAGVNEAHTIALSSISGGWIGLKAPDNVAANITFTLPSVDGFNGASASTDGNGNLSFKGGVNPTIKLSGYVATYNEVNFIDTTSQIVNVLPPIGAVSGDRIHLIDVGGNVIANNVTFQSGVGGYKYYGAAVDDVITTNNFSIKYIYVNSAIGWVREIG